MSSLDEVNDTTLYKMLGEAWFAQRKTESGEACFLSGNEEVGKREFDKVSAVLREALQQPYFQGLTARVRSTLEVEANWTMPVMIVVALARRRGMIDMAPSPHRT
jgi:hypothetical protein